MTDKEFSKYINLCGKKTKRNFNLIPLFKVLSFLFMIIIFFGSGLAIAFIGKKLDSPTFGILILACPLIAIAPYFRLLNIINKSEGRLSTLQNIIAGIDNASVTFFSNPCFGMFSTAEAEKIVKELTKQKVLGDADIFSGLLIAKKELCLTRAEAEAFVRNYKTGGSDNRNIIFVLSDAEDDSYCDNCGKAFYEGERFCGHCGTVRKDLRRRI